jgi:hypothetical protein
MNYDNKIYIQKIMLFLIAMKIMLLNMVKNIIIIHIIV